MVFDNVTLIKEDNRKTERTFSVSISFGDPGIGIRPATHQGSATQQTDHDYVIDTPGNDHLSLSFGPDETEISVSFTLLPDDLPEGNEGFRATIASEGGIFPNFQLPVENSEGIPAYPDALIRILDNDSKLLCLLCSNEMS